MSTITIARFRAAVLLVAPAVMLAGFLYHPHIGTPIEAGFLDRLAAAVVADPQRWAVAHLIVAVGSGLLMLAFLAARGYLREAGEERWSGAALPFIVMGSTLYALLPAMEFAPLAAAAAGADVQHIAATQGALFHWFVPTLFTSAIIFLVGAVGFAVAIVRSGVVNPRLARVVATALVVMAAARFIPLSAVHFHVQGVAGLVALWPLAYAGLRASYRAPQSGAARNARRPLSEHAA